MVLFLQMKITASFKYFYVLGNSILDVYTTVIHACKSPFNALRRGMLTILWFRPSIWHTLCITLFIRLSVRYTFFGKRKSGQGCFALPLDIIWKEYEETSTQM